MFMNDHNLNASLLFLKLYLFIVQAEGVEVTWGTSNRLSYHLLVGGPEGGPGEVIIGCSWDSWLPGPRWKEDRFKE